MLTATAGFLLFSWFLLVRVAPPAVRVAGQFGYGAIVAIHALILLPSALWMPLTFRYLAVPSATTWVLIRAVLFAVGLGALLLVAALASLEPRLPRTTWWLALVGAIAFAVQTALLDAFIWPAFFRRA
jgi:hypothetical protein